MTNLTMYGKRLIYKHKMKFEGILKRQNEVKLYFKRKI